MNKGSLERKGIQKNKVLKGKWIGEMRQKMESLQGIVIQKKEREQKDSDGKEKKK